LKENLDKNLTESSGDGLKIEIIDEYSDNIQKMLEGYKGMLHFKISRQFFYRIYIDQIQPAV
jgi:hypothetical protein